MKSLLSLIFDYRNPSHNNLRVILGEWKRNEAAGNNSSSNATSVLLPCRWRRRAHEK